MSCPPANSPTPFHRTPHAFFSSVPAAKDMIRPGSGYLAVERTGASVLRHGEGVKNPVTPRFLSVPDENGGPASGRFILAGFSLTLRRRRG